MVLQRALYSAPLTGGTLTWRQNENEARYANNGGLPPDLSLIIKVSWALCHHSHFWRRLTPFLSLRLSCLVSVFCDERVEHEEDSGSRHACENNESLR